jgi:UDP-glucose 4-epimerase
MTILITGASGYLGRHLLKSLESEDVDFIALDWSRKSYAIKNFVEGSFFDLQMMERIFSKNNIHKIIHLAALKDVSEALLHPSKYLEENFKGTQDFFEFAAIHGVSKFVFASSAAVYGNLNTLNGHKESGGVAPSNAYGESKLLGETFLEQLCQRNDVRGVSLRFFNLGGAREAILPDLDGNNLIPRLIRASNLQSQFGVYGGNYPTIDGTALRDYVHVDDVVDAIMRSLFLLDSEIRHEILNIGSAEPKSVLEVIDAINSLTNQKIRYNLIGPREGDPYSSFADISKARDVLKWFPKKSFEDLIFSYSSFFEK